MSATDTPSQAVPSRLHSLAFAATYDPLMRSGERAGMAARRRTLVEAASGSVLELGAGTGLNLSGYPAKLERLVLTEPDEAMAAKLERRVARLSSRAEVVRAAAESLPFDDRSFDTVVATLVLCTVADPGRTLHEIRRVLRPGGRMLFIEHVRATSERLARWQDRLHRPWKAVLCGCNCNRDTLELINAAGLVADDVEHAAWKRMPPLVRPLISGVARPRPVA